MQKISFFIFAALLSGCSFWGPDESLPLYTLRGAPIEQRIVLLDSIGIDTPLSESSLNTPRIALTPSPFERDYLADGQWPDRLPKVVQNALLESLGERWGEGHVSRMNAGNTVKYILQTEIQDFSVYYLNTSQSEVHLKIVFKILDLQKRTIRGGQVFVAQESVCVTSMNGIVEAFNRGFNTLLLEAIPWMEGVFVGGVN